MEEKNNKRLEIPIGDRKIVVEIDDANLPEIPAEIFVFIEDRNGRITQNLCSVREYLMYNPRNGVFEHRPDFVDCLIWGDEEDEDYTNKFIIPIRENE